MKSPTVVPRVRPNRLSRARIVALCLVLAGVAAGTLAVRLVATVADLEQLQSGVRTVSSGLASGNPSAIESALPALRSDLDRAGADTMDPSWRLLELLPFVGPNATAVARVVAVGNGLVDRVAEPIITSQIGRHPNLLMPGHGVIPVARLAQAAPLLHSADTATASLDREAAAIDASATVPAVSSVVHRLASATGEVASAIGAAYDADRILPGALGESAPRHYLVIAQNNAELRSSGGVPSSLTLLTIRRGVVSVTQQSAGLEFPAPVASLTPSTDTLYGPITAEYAQDVNLTPDFPVSAQLVARMWQQRFGEHVDGVISVDPVAIGYLLRALGPVPLADGQTLTASNAVSILLSGVYQRYPVPSDQDAFFAATARAILQRVMSTNADPLSLVREVARAISQRRILLTSFRSSEESVIDRLGASGRLPTGNAGATVAAAFLNDATGAKMDYYLRESFTGAVARCEAAGRRLYRLTLTLSSVAPASAATLPAYVTGGGLNGVPPGRVRTLVQLYGPVGATVLGVSVDGTAEGSGSNIDLGRPVVQLPVELGSGGHETITVDLLGNGRSAGPLRLWLTPGVAQSTPVSTSSACFARRYAVNASTGPIPQS